MKSQRRQSAAFAKFNSGSRPASEAMYPSLADLLAANRVAIPDDIVEAVRARYDAHGWEYAAPLEMFGREQRRPVNMCMVTDSIELAREELIDAVFNLMVQIFKEEDRDWRAKSALLYVLGALQRLARPAPLGLRGKSNRFGALSESGTASGIAKSS